MLDLTFRHVLRCTSTILISSFFAFCLSSNALAQSEQKTKKSKKDRKKGAKTEKQVKPEEPVPFSGYDHEFSASIRYNSSAGTIRPVGETEDTNLIETKTGLAFSYGYIASDHVEPIIEAEYLTTTRTISDYTSTGSVLSIDVGFLINLPQIDRETQMSNYASKMPRSEMNLATWIPYFGFLVGTTTATDSAGDATKLSLTDTDLNTKFIFGTRYMLYPNIGLNFSVRALYEKSSSEVTTTATKGAARSKIKIDLRLLTLSLMI